MRRVLQTLTDGGLADAGLGRRLEAAGERGMQVSMDRASQHGGLAGLSHLSQQMHGLHTHTYSCIPIGDTQTNFVKIFFTERQSVVGKDDECV